MLARPFRPKARGLGLVRRVRLALAVRGSAGSRSNADRPVGRHRACGTAGSTGRACRNARRAGRAGHAGPSGAITRTGYVSAEAGTQGQISHLERVRLGRGSRRPPRRERRPGARATPGRRGPGAHRRAPRGGLHPVPPPCLDPRERRGGQDTCPWQAPSRDPMVREAPEPAPTPGQDAGPRWPRDRPSGAGRVTGRPA